MPDMFIFYLCDSYSTTTLKSAPFQEVYPLIDK